MGANFAIEGKNVKVTGDAAVMKAGSDPCCGEVFAYAVAVCGVGFCVMGAEPIEWMRQADVAQLVEQLIRNQ